MGSLDVEPVESELNLVVHVRLKSLHLENSQYFNAVSKAWMKLTSSSLMSEGIIEAWSQSMRWAIVICPSLSVSRTLASVTSL